MFVFESEVVVFVFGCYVNVVGLIGVEFAFWLLCRLCVV